MAGADADLKAALKEVLEKRGVMGELRARVRAEVFQALDDEGSGRPVLCRENLVLNELIREYLLYNNYKYTAAVLVQESGQPEAALQKEQLATELGLSASQDQLPLMYTMVAQCKRSRAHPAASSGHTDSSSTVEHTQPSALIIQGKT